MEDYKPNSRLSREQATQDKKIDKVVTGNVTTKKKSTTKKFADVFLAEDVSTAKSYILWDVLVPKVKNTIEEVLVSTVHAIFGGTSESRKTGSKVSYRSYYDDRNRRNERVDNHYTRSKIGYEFDDVILESRGEAEAVLHQMDEVVSTYGVVTVADLYDMVGITGRYTDNKYGWTDIRSAEPIRVRDGYLIKLPKAMPLD
jgi:hypothetical protein